MAIYKSRWKFPPFYSISKLLQLFFLAVLITAPSLNHLNYCNAESILFFSHNHITSFEPLAFKLAQSGRHQVTIVSPMTPENRHPKINHFYPKAAKELHSKLYSESNHRILKKIGSENNTGYFEVKEGENIIETCRTFYKSPEFQKWASSHQFDLVVIESSFKKCVMPLAYGKWKAKYVLFSKSPDLYSSETETAESSWTDFGLDVEQKESFQDEIQRELKRLYLNFRREWSINPKYDDLVKENLNFGGEVTEILGVSELEKKVALHLTNEKLAEIPTENSKVPPFLAGVGGMHCKETSGKISERGIQKYVEDPQSDGFIFISFGTYLRISALPREKLTTLFETVRNFPKIRFLLKWENIKVPKGLPDNLLLSRWFKQQELLGKIQHTKFNILQESSHPKCLGFINQGGFLSYQQAIFHGVPSIIIPFHAENDFVAKTVQKLDIGTHLEIRDLTVSLLTQAIADLLQNRWKKNVQELSKRVSGQPEAALNAAIWNVEYVLKHDQKDLEGNSIKIPWWKRRITHILSIFFGLVLSVLYLLLQILKGLCRLILKGKKEESRKKKSSKIAEKENEKEKEKEKEKQKPKPKSASKSKADVKKANAKKKQQ